MTDVETSEINADRIAELKAALKEADYPVMSSSPGFLIIQACSAIGSLKFRVWELKDLLKEERTQIRGALGKYFKDGGLNKSWGDDAVAAIERLRLGEDACQEDVCEKALAKLYFEEILTLGLNPGDIICHLLKKGEAK